MCFVLLNPVIVNKVHPPKLTFNRKKRPVHRKIYRLQVAKGTFTK